MAAPQPRVRIAALLASASLVLALGCYSTTPHRAQIASQATPGACANAIAGVFERAGFIEIPTPPKLSMLFTPRMSGPYSSFMRTGTGVGVTIDPASAAAGTCHVTLEALSPDVGCSDAFVAQTCNGQGGAVSMNTFTGDSFSSPGAQADGRALAPCPLFPSAICQLSYAPGEDNDAAVDELARRLQAAFGPSGRVN